MQGGEGTIYGAVANLTSDHVRAAASLVKTGKIYSLAVITNPEIHAHPGRGYQVLTAPIYIGTGDEGHTYGENKLQHRDDTFVIHSGCYSPHRVSCALGPKVPDDLATARVHLHELVSNLCLHSSPTVKSYGGRLRPERCRGGLTL